MSIVGESEFAILQAHAYRIIDQAEEAGFESLSDSEKVFFLVWIADGAIGNGGFHSVCYNSTGDYTYLFADAFRAIGAHRKAQLFEDLVVAFGGAGVPGNQPERYEAHSDLGDEAVRKIDALDDKYYDAPEPIDKYLLHWARQFGSAGKGA